MKPPEKKGGLIMFRKNNFLEYYVQRHYGMDRIYISDMKVADQVRSLTGQKSVSAAQLHSVAYLMGATAKEVLPPRSTKATAPAPPFESFQGPFGQYT